MLGQITQAEHDHMVKMHMMMQEDTDEYMEIGSTRTVYEQDQNTILPPIFFLSTHTFPVSFPFHSRRRFDVHRHQFAGVG